MWVARHEAYEIDEVFIICVYLSVALTFFSLRRWRQVITLVRRQQATIDALTAANREVTAGRRSLQRVSRTDELTGLPNRALLLDRIGDAIREIGASQEEQFAILFLDFDRFKFVNDSLGHQVGDALLKGVAARLEKQLRGGDSVHQRAGGNTIGRLGGDEFVVLVRGIQQPEDAGRVATRLLESIIHPFQLGNYQVYTNASIGIVISSPRYHRADEMLRDADAAMYEAKRLGRGQFAFFDESMRTRALRRVKLESDLRRAIEADQLSLEYQPIVSIANGEIAGVEGLLRWTHPVDGPISPSEFIPIAEESDLIFTLGEWVLWQGARQMAEWIVRLGDLAPQFMSLNVSRKQFNQSGLFETLKQIVNELDIDPERLQIEVTEDTCAVDLVAAVKIMHQIKALGVGLAIDDFGVGTSSLSALQQFPVDVLKVDRSLLSGIDVSPDTIAVVHSLSMLVHDLGIAMVAEGVEHSHQVIALQQLGCQFGQGYYFGASMPPDELEAALKRTRPREMVVEGAMAFDNALVSHLPSLHAALMGHN